MITIPFPPACNIHWDTTVNEVSLNFILEADANAFFIGLPEGPFLFTSTSLMGEFSKKVMAMTCLKNEVRLREVR